MNRISLNAVITATLISLYVHFIFPGAVVSSIIWFSESFQGFLMLISNRDEKIESGNEFIVSNNMETECTTSADCAFNGECIKSSIEGDAIDPETAGICKCFSGWIGSTCEILDLMPVDPEKVGLRLPNRDSSTWGGSVIYYEGDGLYHMFASEIINGCGLYSWTTNSQVIRAVSESPHGPYRKVQLIVPIFAHDANIIRAPSGEFVLFVTALKGVEPIDCRDSMNIYTRRNVSSERHSPFHTQLRQRYRIDEDEGHVSPKDTYMLWASSPDGPWSDPVMVLNSTLYNSDYWKKYNRTAICDSNLNGIILPSNTPNGPQAFYGLWRRCETDDLLTIPHALVASDWKDPSTYTPVVDHALFVLGGSGAEDPSNIWTTQTSDMEGNQVAYHAIFHDEQATRCMLGWCGGIGRHAVSLDGLTWKYATVNAYDRHFEMKGNILPNRSDTRARPHVVLDPSSYGQKHQVPIGISTGLKESDEDGYVFTLVQPLGD